jgi:hypothetical protein
MVTIVENYNQPTNQPTSIGPNWVFKLLQNVTIA